MSTFRRRADDRRCIGHVAPLGTLFVRVRAAR